MINNYNDREYGIVVLPIIMIKRDNVTSLHIHAHAFLNVYFTGSYK